MSESFQFCDIMMAFLFTNDVLPLLSGLWIPEWSGAFCCWILDSIRLQLWLLSKKGAWGDLPVMNTGAVSTVTHGPLFTSQVSLWPLPMVKSFGWSPKGSDYGFQQPKWGLSTGWAISQRGERQSGGTPDLSSRSCAFREAGWCFLGT